MKDSKKKMNLASLDSIFTTQEERDEAKKEHVINLPIEQIQDFPEHPFKVLDNAEMDDLVKSISVKGVILPTIVRQREDGSYEMISGHRRKHAASKAGLKEIPCIIKNLTDDEATILMVDSNIQREELLPSEKAFAYKMKLDAMKNQGKRFDLENIKDDETSRQLVKKFSASEMLGKEVGQSGRTIQRYVRLTNLEKPILELVDNNLMAISPAVEISFLTKQEQEDLIETMESEDRTPSYSQAIRMHKLSEQGKLDMDTIFDIMTEEKPNQRENIKFTVDSLQKYFPREVTPQEMIETIQNLLEKYQRNWQRERHNRDAR